MKAYMMLIGLVICGCVSQPAELTQEERDLQVFYEEPNIDYEDLGRIDATNRADHAIEALDRILSRAVELGADGVIVHSIRNRGPLAGGRDAFGTGGGREAEVYQIQATAIRYLE